MDPVRWFGDAVNKKIYKIIDVLEHAPYFYIASMFFLLALTFSALSLYEFERAAHENTDYAIIMSITANDLATQSAYYIYIAIIMCLFAIISRVYTIHWMKNYNHVINKYKVDVIK